jgi:hypothetical protein
MTDERFAFIAGQIAANGWSYDAAAGQFVMVRGDERGTVKWQDVIALIPGDSSLGDLLDAYADHRKRTDA